MARKTKRGNAKAAKNSKAPSKLPKAEQDSPAKRRQSNAAPRNQRVKDESDSTETASGRARRSLELLEFGQFLENAPKKVWTFKSATEAFYEKSDTTEAQVKHVKRFVADLIKLDDRVIVFTDESGKPLSRQTRERGDKRRVFFKFDVQSQFSKALAGLRESYDFTAYDAFSFIFVQRQISRHAQPTSRNYASPKLEHLISLLPKTIREEAYALADSWDLPEVQNSSKYQNRTRDLTLLQAAILERRLVEIEYRTPGEATRLHRVAPAGIRFDEVNQALHLIAGKVAPDKPWPYRSLVPWKLDRIVSVKKLEEPCPSPRELLVNSEKISSSDLHRGLGALFRNTPSSYFRTGEPYVTVEILVTSPRWIEYIVEKTLHPNQTCRFRNGRQQLLLTIDNCQESQILTHLLPMAPDFQVISPPSLREKVLAIARGIITVHQ